MICCPELEQNYEPPRGRTPDMQIKDPRTGEVTDVIERRIVFAFPVVGGTHSLESGDRLGWILQPTPTSLIPGAWHCPNWTPGT